MSTPGIPTAPRPIMRLLVTLGYSQENIIDAMNAQYGMSDEDARDLYAQVTETTLSADDLPARV
jgi:hypothetical protein